MILKIKYFGLVAETVQKDEEELGFTSDTIESLDGMLKNKYSKLKAISYKYAVNQSIAEDNQSLNDGDEVALLPPFAGG